MNNQTTISKSMYKVYINTAKKNFIIASYKLLIVYKKSRLKISIS